MTDEKEYLELPAPPEELREKYDKLAGLFLELFHDAGDSFLEHGKHNLQEGQGKRMVHDIFLPMIMKSLENPDVAAATARKILENTVASGLASLIKISHRDAEKGEE